MFYRLLSVLATVCLLSACQESQVETQSEENAVNLTEVEAARNLVEAFSIACLSGLDDLDSYEARLNAAGFKETGASERTRGDQVYLVSIPQTPRNEICGGIGRDTNPGSVATALVPEARRLGHDLGSADVAGRRYAIPMKAAEGSFLIRIEPSIAATTRITVTRS